MADGSFGQLLRTTLLQGSSDQAALTPAERRTAGTYGPLSPPSALLRYGNGQIPAEALAQLSSHPAHRLWAPAASAFDRMEADAAAQGVWIGFPAVGALLAWMQQQQASGEDGARHFLRTREDLWLPWVDEAVAARVREAL